MCFLTEILLFLFFLLISKYGFYLLKIDKYKIFEQLSISSSNVVSVKKKKSLVNIQNKDFFFCYGKKCLLNIGANLS